MVVFRSVARSSSLLFDNFRDDFIQMVDVPIALLNRHSFTPESKDAFGKLFFCLWLPGLSQEVLELVPDQFYRVQVRAFRGSWPPIHNRVFVVGFSFVTGVLGVVVLHKSMAAWESRSDEGL